MCIICLEQEFWPHPHPDFCCHDIRFAQTICSQIPTKPRIWSSLHPPWKTQICCHFRATPGRIISRIRNTTLTRKSLAIENMHRGGGKHWFCEEFNDIKDSRCWFERGMQWSRQFNKISACSGATHWLQINRMKLAKPLKECKTWVYSKSTTHNLRRLGFGLSSKLAKCFNSNKGLT